MKLVVVAGARPNFMKVAPLMWEIARRREVTARLVHTGQHYDQRMSKLFFEQLRIPRPDVDLGVGSGSHAVQTAEVMKRFEPVLQAERPDAVVVVGDVNSTVACALTSVKLGVPVAHVEAGLRSFDRSMPEEINRILTDAISRWLFVSEPSGIANLRREGVEEERIFFVGNVMIDTLIACQDQFEGACLAEVEVPDGEYAVLTLHRPSNVDEPVTLKRLMGAVEQIQERMPIVFPVHPRTRKALAEGSFHLPNVRLTEPLGYLEFMKLVKHARLVLTDSGGIQEETTYLGVPCLTLRRNTERPCTVEQGTNVLVGPDPERIVEATQQVLQRRVNGHRIPELWDGQAAERIVDILVSGEWRGVRGDSTFTTHPSPLTPHPSPLTPHPMNLFSLVASDLRAKAQWCYGSARRRDILKTLLTDGTAAMLWYRLMQWARRWRLAPLEMLFGKISAVGCNCIIGRGAEFGPAFVLIHSTGVVINGGVRGGSHVYLEHQVTIGAERRQMPRLGDHVFVGAGAKIVGPVTIGSDCRIGANAVVVHDIPSGATAVGVPAKVVRTREFPAGSAAGPAEQEAARGLLPLAATADSRESG